MYDGPLIDAFLHTPWLGAEDPSTPRGDRMDWSGDRRLQRVMHTFNRSDADGKPASSVQKDALLSEMALAGVERALLPAKIYYPTPESNVLAVHRQLQTFCDGAGDQLKWGASLVPPELGAGTYWDYMRNPQLLRIAAADAANAGLAAVHITPSPWGLPPNHKWYYPSYAACSELGLPVLAYVGMPGPLWPMDTNNPRHLAEVARAFPDLTIIAHHIGDPWVDISIRLAARHPNFYICTSAWSPKAYPKPLIDFLKGRWHGTKGCDKVIYASDYPLLDMQRTARDVRMLDLSREQHERFVYANALKIFWP